MGRECEEDTREVRQTEFRVMETQTDTGRTYTHTHTHTHTCTEHAHDTNMVCGTEGDSRKWKV